MDDVTSMYYSDMLLARLGSRLVGLLATRREADEGRKLPTAATYSNFVLAM